ncbi:hypothetical protein FHS89_003219 [Rubricella aquisinus]|uniref:DUF1643 domain-containing protein n=1 Tax=Rubricella aquisinus TaxID=2028108 RepID=A0A840WU14_9RHOB|nr:DUF1643 domain-containing protein [Rubricella aquisinus]MBB5517172.1 hypothetical protein [Rubricella aquisinus]
MIERHHQDERAVSSAVFSDCEQYRYTLTRRWAEGPGVMFLMLNPSTADEFRNDPTVERCERRARALGYGAFRVCNIFAYRATDPKVMRAAADPIGPGNDAAIMAGCDWAKAVVAAWGTHGAHLDRGPAVADMLHRAGIEPLTLGLSKHGHPKHPLYIGYAVQPTRWEIGA